MRTVHSNTGYHPEIQIQIQNDTNDDDDDAVHANELDAWARANRVANSAFYYLKFIIW